MKTFRELVEGVSPLQKEVAKKIKDYFKKQKIKVSVQSSGTKSDYIRVWSKDDGVAFPADMRNYALDAIYGKSFDRNREEPQAGNVNSGGITMQATEWQKFLDMVK